MNLKSLEESSSTRMEGIVKKIIGKIDDKKNKAVESIGKVQADSKEELQSLVTQFKGLLSENKKANDEEREQRKELREEAERLYAEYGKMATEVKMANVLLALDTDPLELKIIHQEKVERLLKRISTWYRERMLQRKIWTMIF